MRELANFGLNALWQVPVLALLAVGAAALGRKLAPGYRTWIWFAALVTVGTIPALSVWRAAGHVNIGGAVLVLKTDAIGGPIGETRVNWTALAILLLIAARLIFLLAGWLKLRSLRSQSQGRVILRNEVAAAPFTFGATRPMIVVPEGLWTSASASLRRAILAHERAHIRRRDYLWNFLTELATSAVWWHPAVWWLKSRYAMEREFACDEQAARRVPGYARHVLDAAQLITGRTPGLALGLFDSNVLEERMMKLIERPSSRPGSFTARAIQFAVIFALVAGAIMIARHPVALAAPQAKEKTPIYSVKDTTTPPSLVAKVEPGYTEEAKDAKIEGTCYLSVVISEEGIAEDIRVEESLDSGLDQKAIEAVEQWRFSPGKKDGKPVRVAAKIEINFRLL